MEEGRKSTEMMRDQKAKADSCKHVVEKMQTLMSMHREELQELSDVERCVFIKALSSEFGYKEESDDPNKTV